MPYKDPKAITEAGTVTGAKKARLAPNKALLAGFLAGAYIGFGGLLAITVSSGLEPERWGTLAHAVHRSGLHRRPDARGDRRLRAADRQHGARPARAHAGQDQGQGPDRQLHLGARRQPARRAVRRLLPRRAVRGADRGPAVRATQRDRSRQGHRGDRVADLPARAGLQLARLPRGVDGARRRRRHRQDPRDLLPDHGLRGDGLRPRDREHVLPARRDVRGRRRPDLVGRRSTTGSSPSSGTSSAPPGFVAGWYYYLYGRDEEEAKPGDTPHQSRPFEHDGAERETVSGRG